MGSQQQFCLRWNNHQTNMLNVFDHLLQSETLVDVTLACDGVSLRAHKVVLSACSPYFQALFAENPCKHPIVILKDIPYSELRALVHFMYKGEVNVSQEKLPALLKTAEHLKVKGLSEVTQVNHNGAAETTMTAANRHVPAVHHIETLPVVSHSPPPQMQPSSPGPPKKKKCHRDTSDSMSPGGGSDLDETDSLNLRGSPEVLEARVDLPQNMDDDTTQDGILPSQHDEMPNKPYGRSSPMETKDHLVSHSPREEDTNANRFGGEPSYPPHDAGVMVASLPSTSTFQNSQGAFQSPRRALAYAPQRCRLCHKVISNIYNFRKHMKVHSPVQLRFECHLCLRVYNREDNLRWHLRTKHGMQLRRKPRRSSSEGPPQPPGPPSNHAPPPAVPPLLPPAPPLLPVSSPPLVNIAPTSSAVSSLPTSSATSSSHSSLPAAPPLVPAVPQQNHQFILGMSPE